MAAARITTPAASSGGGSFFAAAFLLVVLGLSVAALVLTTAPGVRFGGGTLDLLAERRLELVVIGIVVPVAAVFGILIALAA